MLITVRPILTNGRPTLLLNCVMKKTKLLILILWVLVPMVLIVATILEKWQGTPFVVGHIYGSSWFVMLWAVWVIAGGAYIFRRSLHRRPFTFALHAALTLILLGALTTWLWGTQGKLQLRQGKAVSAYITNEGHIRHLPFSVQLDTFVVVTYAGTASPQDYLSRIILIDEATKCKQAAEVSMNRICSHRGFRFYQSGYDADGRGSTLRVSYDPWGIGLTYAGYALLLISMMGFFFDKRSAFRQSLKHWKTVTTASVFFVSGLSASAQNVPTPQVLPHDIAEEMGNLYVNHNGRICPLQTAARDFTLKLCGATEYEGLSSEQVLTAWMFYHDTWKNHSMLRIKNAEARAILGIKGEYASLHDFVSRKGEDKIAAALQNLSDAQTGVKHRLMQTYEQFTLANRLCRGEWLKLFPIATGNGKGVDWYAWNALLPSKVDDAEAILMHRRMNELSEHVKKQNWTEVRRITNQLKEFQIRQMGNSRPDNLTVQAERLYNRYGNTRPLSYICLFVGLSAFAFVCRAMVLRRSIRRRFILGCELLALLSLLWLTFTLVLRSIVSGHLPFSNGYETMQLMGLCALLLALVFLRRFPLIGAAGVLTCGLTLLVAGMGESQPQITPLMPVLHSPLLSWHVAIIMAAYVLLAFVMLMGVAALCVSHLREDTSQVLIRMQAFSHVLLLPAVFLLAIGIFIGAVWANISWGRYWGWDPKETWALITLLVYALPLHGGSYGVFRRPMVFHLYCVIAFLTVLMTYFGVNFLLGGMHSYAG